MNQYVSAAEPNIYNIPFAQLNAELRRGMPTLDTIGQDLSACAYCKKALTRGHPERHQRPEVEHIVEIQVFIDTMKFHYGDLDEPIISIPQARWNTFHSFVNSQDNLVIACGSCNLVKCAIHKAVLASTGGGFVDFTGDEEEVLIIVLAAIRKLLEKAGTEGVPSNVLEQILVTCLEVWAPTDVNNLVAYANLIMKKKYVPG